MINQQLLNYISRQQEAGTDDAVIKDKLAEAGWRKEDIEEGFQAVADAAEENSPETHQQIRSAAAGQRSSGSPDQSADDKGKQAQTTSDTSDTDTDTNEADSSDGQSDDASTDQTDDTYREPVTEADTDADNAPGGAALSAIDESTSDDSQRPTRQLADEDTATDTDSDTSEQTTDTESGQEPAASVDTQSGGEDEQTVRDDMKDPLASNEKMAAVQSRQSDDTDGSDPVSVRTLRSDVEQVTGRPFSDRPQQSSADTDEAEPSDQSATQEESQSPQRERQQKQSNERPAQKRQSATESTASKSESSGDSPERRRGKKPVAGAEVANQPQQSSEPDRSTDDGRRRFATGKQDLEAAKQRAATRKRDRARSGSGSGRSRWVSILLFVLAIVLVGGGAVWAYFTYFQTETPTTTAAAVMESLSATETFDFRITIETASDGTESRQIVEGAIDLNEASETQSYYTITTDNQNQTPLRAVMAEVENITAVPAEQLETVQDVVLTPQFFSVGEFQTTERLGQTESSNGFMTNRFSVSMNPSQLISDYATLHQALFNSPLSASVLENLQATIGSFQPSQGQAWLDTETGAPYQITFIGTNGDGQDVQVNFQFKNHGADLETTPPYEPRSAEQVLGQYFAANPPADTTSSPPDTTPTTTQATTSDTDTAETGTTTDTTPPTDTTPQPSATDRARQQDYLRINDIQQLVIALRIHANETGSFPASLSALRDSSAAVLRRIPTDPATGENYLYSISADDNRYHLGAVMRQLTRGSLSGDANFNSRGQGYPNGFNGATLNCGQEAITNAATCYDVTATTE